MNVDAIAANAAYGQQDHLLNAVADQHNTGPEWQTEFGCFPRIYPGEFFARS